MPRRIGRRKGSAVGLTLRVPLPRAPRRDGPDGSSRQKTKIRKGSNMTAETTTSPGEALIEALAMHTGSETVFRHWSRRLVYTEGVQGLAERAQAYWLIDLVASYVTHPALHGEDFVVWKLTVDAKGRALAVAEDGNGRKLVEQQIPVTDFPPPGIELFMTNGTLLLTSEY
jgi:hypothetical protein